jgi:tRNA dimethylallyltransferase
VGPTASGKTEAAVLVARRLGCEIVSADSMLVYEGMDVGTAKPTVAERGGVPHHLIDVARPQAPFSVAAYQRLAQAVLADIALREGRPLIVGGSGLYYRAVSDDLEFPRTDPRIRLDLETEALADAGRLFERLTELDPAAAAKIEPGNTRRIVRALEVPGATGNLFSSYATRWEDYPGGNVRAAGIGLSREAITSRVRLRVNRMLENGFLAEVRGLVERGLGEWLTSSQAIGYAEMALHLEGKLTLNEAVAGTVKRTKALARRQLAWFRRDPRVRWFECDDGAPAIVDEISEYLGDV